MPAKLGRALLRRLPERLAVALSYWESCRPPHVKVTPVEQAALASASRLRFGRGDRNVAHCWAPEAGPHERALVVLVHGWGGRAAQMAPLGAHLASIGYRAVAPDITGHGDSPGRHTTWPHFFGDLAALAQSLGEPVYAYVGHSIGGLAVVAARRIVGTRATRYVCVGAPSHPWRGVETLKRRLDPSPQALERYRNFIAAQFEAPSWAALESGWAFGGCGAETLVVHDAKDRFVPLEEADRIAAAHPRVVVRKIQANGHNRILVDPGFMALVGDFLSQREPATLAICDAC